MRGITYITLNYLKLLLNTKNTNKFLIYTKIRFDKI